MELYKIIILLSATWSAISALTIPVTPESISPSPSSLFDEYFKPEATEQKRKENRENCDKVIKNGMMCLVCTDQENGKSEQCAYISHPPKKYLGEKKPEPDIDELTKPSKPTKKYKNLRRYDESAESEDSSNYSADFDGFGDYYPDYTSKSEKLSKADSNDCEEVAKDDGTVCTVCKDQQNGGNSERCRRAYQPKESVYGYSRSRSFGLPKEKSGGSGKAPKKSGDSGKAQKKKSGGEKSQSYRRRDNAAEDGDHEPYGDRTPYGYDGEGEKSGGGDGNCQEVERDGMICTVCVNPKTNGKSEQCSYSYKPEDELFAYTNSRSYGSPSERKG